MISSRKSLINLLGITTLSILAFDSKEIYNIAKQEIDIYRTNKMAYELDLRNKESNWYKHNQGVK